MLIQQGDVLIKKSVIPGTAKQKNPSARGIVLAEGENTGHAHVIANNGDAILMESDNELYLRVIREVTIVHEEHGAVKVPKGDYKIDRVKEYDHFAEEARNVRD